jgi:hypothetical protein
MHGLTACEHNRKLTCHLTVEWSLLLPNMTPRWRELFSDQYRDAARWRLQQADVEPPEDDT